jgi:hypothetical protein
MPRVPVGLTELLVIVLLLLIFVLLVLSVVLVLLVSCEAVVKYSSSRLPAPQYSFASPPQIMLQSAKGADVLVLSRLLPQ